MKELLKRIPHRPPFLFIDEILSMTEKTIEAVRTFRADETFFKGHYPGFPIVPGALVCEAIFQASAVLLSTIIEEGFEGIPVVTRIKNAKFKNMARPGDELRLVAELVDRVSNAVIMKGQAFLKDRIVATVEFTCALVEEPA
jgi:3-hydroxyacyl-[acyl-carrier-protein] dehydratase